MKLALVGYGALGRYIEAMIGEAHPVDPAATVCFDDNRHRDGEPRAQPFAAHTDDAYAGYSFFVCLGYKHLALKQRVIAQLIELGRDLPSFVHPSAYLHPTATIGRGSMVYPGCNIDRNTRIGSGTWITNGDVIAHDCAIGDACWFGASVTLSGHVTVGDRTFIGSGATVANDAAIGSDVIVGMGTAVTTSVRDKLSAIGNPMRILDRPLTLI